MYKRCNGLRVAWSMDFSSGVLSSCQKWNKSFIVTYQKWGHFSIPIYLSCIGLAVRISIFPRILDLVMLEFFSFWKIQKSQKLYFKYQSCDNSYPPSSFPLLPPPEGRRRWPGIDMNVKPCTFKDDWSNCGYQMYSQPNTVCAQLLFSRRRGERETTS